MQSAFHNIVEAVSETFFMALDRAQTAAPVERRRLRWSTPETLTVIKLGTEQGAFYLGIEAGTPLQEDDRFVGLRDLLPESDYERSMRPLGGLMPMEIKGILSDCQPSAFLEYLYCVALSIVAARVKRRFSSAQVFAFFDDENPFPDLLRFPNELCDAEDEFEAVLTALKLEPQYVAVLRELFRAGKDTDQPGIEPLSVGEKFLSKSQ